MANLRFATLLWIFAVHLAGIYLFTRGFLLMRLSLANVTDYSNDRTLPRTHSRAVVLVIDALRFDFLSPTPPRPVSPYHHNVMTLPGRLTKERPAHSLLFDSYADPPTTTLQRIKGITTGSLPTFLDIGNSLAASSITEDSILVQLNRAGKKAAFMGDDTWMSVFPASFEANMSFPYDSFNVEDLHTVDEGVIDRIFPLLEDPSKPFDFLVGHFLGVDHVGHRVGPDHPLMKAKLSQLDAVLERVVEAMDDDTLLVVLGDHGMDRSGDHGGDSGLETSAAMWFYSKSTPLREIDVPSGLLQYRTFPDSTVPYRGIQQIDLLPTLSLLLGLPIPFNNLGSVIPEMFSRSLEKALEINARQIQDFLVAYRASPSGGELDDAWDSLQRTWAGMQSITSSEAKSIAYNHFARQTLAACRAMWAQFNPVLMGMGLLTFAMSLCASWGIYVGLQNVQAGFPRHLIFTLGGGATGAIVSLVARVLPRLLEGVGMVDCIVFGAATASCLSIILLSPPFKRFPTITFPGVLLILHAAAFLSNSFTFWEDRVLPFLAVSAIVPYAIKAFTAPTSRLRWRIGGFSLLYSACIRLMSVSTVCREEQTGLCHVTFYASSSITAPPTAAVILAIPMAVALPIIIKRFLAVSRSDQGVAKIYYPTMFSPSILSGALFWILEWAETLAILGEDWNPTLRSARTWLAIFALSVAVVVGGVSWVVIPLCVKIAVKQEGANKQVEVIGFANAFGSPYLLFWSISLAAVYASSQVPGQLVLGLATIALLSFLEVVDSVRDVKSMEVAFASSTPSTILDPTTTSAGTVPVRFSDIVPLALLGLHTFYCTGHQATIPSVQWKTAFVLTPTVKYPWSPLTVVINSVGPIFLFAVAVPLVALWNRAPQGTAEKDKNTVDLTTAVNTDAALAGVGMMTYNAALLFGTSISAAILRRHLMVWKVFAPRFMLAVLTVLAVDMGVMLGIGVGVNRISAYVQKFFKGMGQSVAGNGDNKKAE